ncbi:MAG TPA: hypothetical protein VKA43_10180 [Gammaproteobacteria bacterium]|nr:hypothetical protein [Gammaproteobacteria bacterium]
MTRLRLSVAALLCLVSTSAWADLRTYDVEFQYRNEIYEALRNLLAHYPGNLNTGSYGTVQLLPSGQILVNAPPETLEQVDQLLRAIRERPAAATPRVSLRYWVVVGTRAASNTVANGQTTVTVAGNTNTRSTAPIPSALNGVVAELERFHGDLTFRVLGTAAVVSESGQPGGVEGLPLGVTQVAHVQGDRLNAEITMELTLPVNWAQQPENVADLEVRTSLERGEFVVLGESTHQGNGVDGTLFYIVHWPENE